MLPRTCSNCDEMEKILKKSKESIRSLKLQYNRLQDEYAGLRKSIVHPSAFTASNETNFPTEENQVDSLRLLLSQLQQRYDQQEGEMSKLRKDLNSERGLKDEQVLLLERKINDYHTQVELLQTKLHEKESNLHEQDRYHRKLVDQYESLESQLQGKESSWAFERTRYVEFYQHNFSGANRCNSLRFGL
jgi:DNA repair exonuclease SbcCD ATPase subunit